MSEKLFLAGATGAIGTALMPLLIDAGYVVYGSTRRAERAKVLEAKGVTPVIVDAFDSAALTSALVRISPSSVIHQLSDLPPSLDPKQMAEAGGPECACAQRRHTQSGGSGSRGGLRPVDRAEHRLGLRARPQALHRRPSARPRCGGHSQHHRARCRSIGAVDAGHARAGRNRVEVRADLRAGHLHARACRCYPRPCGGRCLGSLAGCSTIARGIFNITDDNPDVSSAKAQRELGWNAGLRLPRRLHR